DVADRAADLAQHEVEALVALADEVLDGVGDVRDDLDGGAEIVAAPLLGEDLLVDAAGGDVVLARRRPAGEALVMAEIEVGLGAVVGDEHLAVLVGRHGAGIDVEVGVELAQPDLVAARLQERAEAGGSETFAEGGDHAAGDENVPRHGAQLLTRSHRFDESLVRGYPKAADRPEKSAIIAIAAPAGRSASPELRPADRPRAAYRGGRRHRRRRAGSACPGRSGPARRCPGSSPACGRGRRTTTGTGWWRRRSPPGWRWRA